MVIAAPASVSSSAVSLLPTRVILRPCNSKTSGPPAAGGGTLLDFCSHLVDQALVLLGPANTVYAQLRTRDSGLDDDVFLALTHADGVRSHISGSWSQGAPGARFRLTGTDGAYVNNFAGTAGSPTSDEAEGAVLFNDELAAQGNHEEYTEPAADESEKKDARVFEIEAQEDEGWEGEDDS